MGFEVTYGMYQGKPGEIGYDGRWRRGNQSLLLEAKTTMWAAGPIDKFNAEGFYKRLRDYVGWTAEFFKGDDVAREIHFETPEQASHNV